MIVLNSNFWNVHYLFHLFSQTERSDEESVDGNNCKIDLATIQQRHDYDLILK